MTTANQLAGYASSLPNFRNRIINGDMRIDQRNAGSAVTTGYPVDRFNTYSAGITNWQAQQVSEGPAGFSKSVKYICTPSTENPDATDYLNFVQRIEGFNFYDFNYGTADAKSFTLSFYLKTNLAGTYGISFHNNAFNRVYVATYTVSQEDASAENWVRYSILVLGDTSGAWEVGNLVGLAIEFCLSIGTDRDGSTGSWSSTSSVFGAIGQVNLLSNTSNYWQITGVQLEEGTVATPFEHRPYGVELALCQRYTYRHSVEGNVDSYAPLCQGRYYGTNDVQCYIPFKQTMRTSPSSITQIGNLVVNSTSLNPYSISLALNETSSSGATLTGSTTSGTTEGNATTVYSDNTSNAAIIFYAEL